MKGLSGIGTNLLASRLKELESAGLIEKTQQAPPSGSTVYQLTEEGQTIEPVVYELIKWGLRFPNRYSDDNLSLPEWDIVALKALFDANAAQDISDRYQLEIDGVSYYVDIHQGQLSINLGTIDHPDISIRTDRVTFSQLGNAIFTEQAKNSGKLNITGDPQALNRFRKIFSASKVNTG